MSSRYSHLLSPLMIGDIILKNRMYYSQSLPHFLQGPENFPASAVIDYYAGVAKDGCALITCFSAGNVKPRYNLPGDQGHVNRFDEQDQGVQNYLSQMADAVHFFDSRIILDVRPATPSGYDISELPKPAGWSTSTARYSPHQWPVKEMPADMLQTMIDDTVKKLELFKTLDFDGVHLFLSQSAFGKALLPAINKRTDQYGGSRENRCRAILELCQAIKKACGDNFLISVQLAGEKPESGYTVDDLVAYAKNWEGTVDILEIKGSKPMGNSVDPLVPIGFDPKKKDPDVLRYAQVLKESGTRIVTAPNGGFQHPEACDKYIAEGKTDMVSMAAAYICDPEYGKKVHEGRGEDVVPCIRCYKCHGISWDGPWYSVCSVNPTIGIAHRLNTLIAPAERKKKLAIIGGGPAGLKAALTAAARGHEVTLFERTDYLGGQLRHSDYASFKWPLQDFKNYLVEQVYKHNIEILLNTTATPELIKAGDYQAVIAAIGAEPNRPDIPGAESSNIWLPVDVYGRAAELAREVVVVGGSSIGTETGMYLAENGHDVTVLTRQQDLATDNPGSNIRYMDRFRAAWEALETFHYITEATTKRIQDGQVVFTDAAGEEKSLQAGSVVLAGGMNPKQKEALTFYQAADRLYIIGDCREVGNVQKSIRSAFAIASAI